VTFSLDMRLGARAGFKRNERMLSLDPRYVVAFPRNGVLERLVIEAKARRITVVDRRGPLGTSPKAPANGSECSLHAFAPAPFRRWRFAPQRGDGPCAAGRAETPSGHSSWAGDGRPDLVT